MTSLEPRAPYTETELARFFPSGLQLQQVQVLLRHGERTPVSARFKNAGLAAHWPYCEAASQFRSVIRTADGSWDTLTWKRRLQSFGQDDAPVLAIGAGGEVDSICQPGELTDRGRETTLALGQRLRHLYVDQLGFLPATLSAPEIRLRSTPIQRALESVQQAFTGLYSSSQRAPGLPLPTVLTRSMQDETLFPNDGGCKRFAELSHAFAERAAKLYNDSPEMYYINKRVGKWMAPAPGSTDQKPQPVAVDSRPRLSGLMDTINSTLAHGPATRLPAEFYDAQLRSNMDRICVEEWFAGYSESNEYRKLGIGAQVGDITQAMVEHVTGKGSDSFKMSLSGCHDTTLAACLAALGAFDYTRDKWPRYTSSIAFELFQKPDGAMTATTSSNGTAPPSKEKTWWSTLFGSKLGTASPRAPLATWPAQEQKKLDNYYVRLRYNDQPVTIPFCKQPGNHLEGDESFCTLAAFKSAVDSFTPTNWKSECGQLGGPTMKLEIEKPPGVY